MPLFLGAACAQAALAAAAAAIDTPLVQDPDLQISLFAAEPDIVTPIGLAVDARGRVFAVESNTHETKGDYSGHAHDRVKWFMDADGDGKPDQVMVFADGLRHAMNIAFSSDQKLFLTHRAGVFRLDDNDGDGVSEARTEVVRLETEGRYPHNGIDGIAFSPNGWLYFGLGENLGLAYTVHGSDGSKHSGGGEGGNVFRCRPNGGEVQLVATGFWNPFVLEFDRAGHLFCADNDPDGRPPCRLLHIVEGGDYGYKFRYGRSGQHPFVAWEGELPGTLPMIAGTAEAPSGILDTARARLPARYADDLFVTGWGDNVIERFTLRRAGASFRADKQVLVRGDASFRPVAIVAAPDGAIFISDWADRSYPVHGKGRIWRLTTKPGIATVQGAESRVKLSNEAETVAEKVRRFSNAGDRQVRDAVLSDDPFLRSAGIDSLARILAHATNPNLSADQSADYRLAELLACRRSNLTKPQPVSHSFLRAWLRDADERIRFMALLWIGEDAILDLAGEIDAALDAGPVSPELFKAYLAASDLLAAAKSKEPWKKSIWDQGPTGAQLLERTLRDRSKPANLRALAASMLGEVHDEKLVQLLASLAREGDEALRLEAVRSLGQSSSPRAAETLMELAEGRANSTTLRAEAVLALTRQPGNVASDLARLLDDPEPAVQIEAARALRPFASQEATRQVLARKLAASRNAASLPLLEQLTLALSPSGNASVAGARPGSDEEWLKVLSRGGDIEAGRRVFFAASSACSTCHRVNGRGGQVGPDLSKIGGASDRTKLVQSILNPSLEIGPQFVSYNVETRDGEIFTSLLHGRGPGGAMTLALADGRKVELSGAQIASSKPSALSLMPDGLEQTLTVQDFRDLVVFLSSLK